MSLWSRALEILIASAIVVSVFAQPAAAGSSNIAAPVIANQNVLSFGPPVVAWISNSHWNAFSALNREYRVLASYDTGVLVQARFAESDLEAGKTPAVILRDYWEIYVAGRPL